jgi:acetyltransferase-like isoleucine patch superfamily enzyme
VRALWLRTVFALDRLRFGVTRMRMGRQLDLEGPVSPNFRLSRIRTEPGARIRLGRGVTTERQEGNHLWVQRDGTLEIGEEAWLRTEHGENRLTVYPAARISIGPRALVNGAMIVAKQEVRVGADARLAFGVRVLDADLHDFDQGTPERVEPVRIGERVWLGANVLVLRGVTIGDDVVVAAGSIVIRDLPPRVLAVGTPAAPIREIAPRHGCS